MTAEVDVMFKIIFDAAVVIIAVVTTAVVVSVSR